MTKEIKTKDQVLDFVKMITDHGRHDLALDILLDCFNQACDLINQLQETISEQEKRLTEYSWQTNPDRMGGQFTEDEIRNSGWK